MPAGTIPIPGAKTAAQAKEHVGALGWNLDDNEGGIIMVLRTTEPRAERMRADVQ